MNVNLSWLPPLLTLSQLDDDWNSYLDAVYSVFKRDYVESRPKFRDREIKFKKYPVILGKEATFWHLISSGESEDSRIPDLRRCERISWPKAIIESAGSNEVKEWENLRRGERRILLATSDFSYIVILADRGKYILLWTAYCIEFEHNRKKLQREYEQYVRI